MAHESIVRQWFEGIWDRGEVEVADRLLATDGRLFETALVAEDLG